MPIEDYYEKLNNDNYCEVNKEDICVNQFIRYYNKNRDTLPFCYVVEVFPNRLRVSAYKNKRQWFVSFNNVDRFFTPSNKNKRFIKKNSDN